MPRLDPLNNRGPAIGGGKNRTTTDEPCATCTDSAVTAQAIITSETESRRLWRHVAFGTGTCVGMMEGYAEMGLPHPPVADMLKLRERINTLIEKTNADPPTDERTSPSPSDDAGERRAEDEHDVGPLA